MNIDEAKDWLDQMSEEQQVQIIKDHHQLKQELCAKILGVPTGCDDWVNRSLKRAVNLRSCEHHLRVLITGTSTLLEQAKWDTFIEECSNCQGTKRVQGEPCCSCQGTGRHRA